MLAAGERLAVIPPTAAAAGRALARRGRLLLACAGGTLLGASALAGGGSSDDAVPWIGGGALGVCAVIAALAVAGRAPWPSARPAALASLTLFALLVAWLGGSIAWSYGPDLSWGAFNRGLAYLGLLLVGFAAGSLLPQATRVVASGLALTVAAATTWALAGKIDPGLFEDGARAARLRAPVGYWNALALLLAFGIPLGLWLATRREHRAAVRALGVGLVLLVVPALLLTGSRGGILVAILVAIGWVALVPWRLESFAVLALGGIPGLVVGAWALSQPGLAQDLQEEAARASAGRSLGIALGLAFAAVFVVAVVAARREARLELAPDRRRRLERLAALATLLAVLVAIGVQIGRQDHPLGYVEQKIRDFNDPQQVSDAGTRIGDTSSNDRVSWWGEAARVFADHPLLGSGAETFRIMHRLERDDDTLVLEPHNLPLQFLSETGLVGAALLGGALVLGLVAAWRTLRRLPERERAAGLALLLVVLAYPVHGLLDFDWDFLAVTGPTLIAAGALLGAGGETIRGPARPALVVGPLAWLAVLVISLALPPLSQRATAQAYDAVSASVEATTAFDASRHANDAVRLARRAASLDPLSVDALWALAEAQTTAGRPDLARIAYQNAVALQPNDPEVYREWAIFEASVANDPALALRIAITAASLDPNDRWIRDVNIGSRCALGLPLPAWLNWDCATNAPVRPG
ncbi:MAG: O-antigen ligase family protein [Thermoleophilia bacterium]